MSNLHTRNSDFKALIERLTAQKLVKVDHVIEAKNMRFKGGELVLSGQDVAVTEEGVTDVNGRYRPSFDAVAALATRMGISTRYLRRLVKERPDLVDANLNGLLLGKRIVRGNGEVEEIYPSDERTFLLRLFADTEGGVGTLRTVLSDQYGMIDHLDVLAAVMEGITAAEVDAVVRSCDLTDSYMNVKVHSPSVAAAAPAFLGGYRNPFGNRALEEARQAASGTLDHWNESGRPTGDSHERGSEPVVFAGFRFSNSETGEGAFTLKPELFVEVCKNGLTLPMFGVGKRHIGSKLETGTVKWTLDTQKKNLALVSARARDAVAEWLSPEFLGARVEELESDAGAPVESPDKAIKVVAKTLGFSDEERDGIFSHFMSGGQNTAAGVANAITSYSQTLESPTRADAMDDVALRAMRMVAAASAE